jgi:dolichol-phosphate mannosyltransferase
VNLTLVIAAYNECENIGPLTSRLIATLDGMTGWNWDLIYVIEGTDSTLSIAQTFAAERREIRILFDPSPSGLGVAFKRGFAAVSTHTDVVVTMDADLNHQPEEIPRLVRGLFDRNADIVIGSRKVAESRIDGSPVWKVALSTFVNRMLKEFARMPVADQTSGYRVYRFSALRKISFETTGFAFLPEILLRARSLNMHMVEEPITFIFRKAGESKMDLFEAAGSYASMFFARLFPRPK